MCESEYVSVHTSDELSDVCEEDDNESWKPLLRQVLISSCVWCQYFQFGLCLGAPTVIIPHMRAERGEQYVSREMASWMSSAMSYSAVPWVPILTTLSWFIGRRYTFAFVVMTSFVGFAVLIVGDTPEYVLAGMILQGTLTSVSLTISIFVLTEYSSPHNRGVFLSIKSANLGWAIWIANAIGTFTHWHYIAWLGIACSLYNALVLFLWPESPYWLASKGRLEQCREAHRWLKGRSHRSEKELHEIIKGHEQHCKEETTRLEDKKKRTLDNSRQTLLGKLVVAVYAIDIIKDISKSKHEAYKGMLILDGVTVLGMYVGCGFSKKLSRRMLLIAAGGAGSVFMLIMSMYLFLVRFGVVLENKYITLVILTCYSLSVSCGPFILSSAIKGELLPLRLRGTASAIMGMCTFFTSGTLLKISPYVFMSLGMDGAFLLYGVMAAICLVILYIYLPETKDKTLKEIQDMILGIKDTDDECDKTKAVIKSNNYECKERVKVELDDSVAESYLPFAVRNNSHVQ